MSYYYNYTIGYEKDGKIYPLGPYDAHGNLKDVVSRSRSFASDLHFKFYEVPREMISDELRDAFSYHPYGDTDDEMEMSTVKYLPMSALPHDSPIKKGYYLIESVNVYESTGDTEYLFDDVIAPTIFAAKLQNELVLGKPTPHKDCEGEEFIEHSASDYMFYAAINPFCEEYEAEELRREANILDPFDEYNIVILETEG